MSKKTINPRRLPVSQSDLQKAKNAAMSEAVKVAYAIIFTVLRDKEDFTTAQLDKIWQEVNELSDSIVKGYVKISDLLLVLKEEAGIVIK